MLIGSLIAPFTAFDTPDDTGGQASPEPEAQAPEPEPFSEEFDPANLTPEQQGPYQHFLGHYQRKTQSLAEERRNLANPQSAAQQFASWTPEERQAFFENAGLEYESGDDPEEIPEDDPDDDFFRDPRVDVILAERQQQQQVDQQNAFQERQLETVNDGIDALEKSTGREFDQDEIDLIGDLSMRMLDDKGNPQVEDAYRRLAGVITKRRGAQDEPKRRARPAPKGQPGVEEVDLLDTDTRRRAIAAEIEAAGAEETI